MADAVSPFTRNRQTGNAAVTVNNISRMNKMNRIDIKLGRAESKTVEGNLSGQ